jgi:hypothetical protein
MFALSSRNGPRFRKKNDIPDHIPHNPNHRDTVDRFACFSEALQLHSSVNLFAELRFQILILFSNRANIDEHNAMTGQPTSSLGIRFLIFLSLCVRSFSVAQMSEGTIIFRINEQEPILGRFVQVRLVERQHHDYHSGPERRSERRNVGSVGSHDMIARSMRSM